MTKTNLIYTVVVASFVLGCLAVYLFLTGSSEAAAVSGAVAVALTGAASRGKAQQAVEEAGEALEAVRPKDAVPMTLYEAEDTLTNTREAMAEVEVEELTPEEKLALLQDLHGKESSDA